VNDHAKTMRKAILLLASSLTVMAGATVAPSLPQISRIFSGTPDSEILTRLILTGHALFIAVCAPIVGLIIDRVGRRKMLLGSLFLYGLSGSSGWYLESLTSILVGRAFLGVAVAGVMTTCTTLIADYYLDDERKAFMGMQAAFMGFGGVVFVALGGVLADLSWRAPFLVYLSSLLLIPWAFLFMYEPRVAAAKPKQQSPRTVPLLLIGFIYVAAFFGMAAFFMIPVQLPFFISELGGKSNTVIGLAIGMAILAAAVCSLCYRRIKSLLSFPGVFAVSFLLMGFGYGIMMVAEGYAAVLAATILAGMGAGLSMPNSAFWTVSVARESNRGRLVGGLTTAVALGQFFSPIVLQPVISATSMRGAFGVAGAFLLIVAAGFVAAHWASWNGSQKSVDAR
jgi:MFS family permease